VIAELPADHRTSSNLYTTVQIQLAVVLDTILSVFYKMQNFQQIHVGILFHPRRSIGIWRLVLVASRFRRRVVFFDYCAYD
jgi:hypothetical protein